MTKQKQQSTSVIRAGLKDLWNSHLVKGATFCKKDIPLCPTTANKPPKRVVSWPLAKEIHKAAIARGENDYYFDACVHFYVDDAKFDGPRKGIWANPENTLSILGHFAGIITPDFSTYQDFPEPIKLYNTYRMRFNVGFDEMLKRLEPTMIIVVGSANYPCFKKARKRGIEVISFDSETSLYFSDAGEQHE